MPERERVWFPGTCSRPGCKKGLVARVRAMGSSLNSATSRHGALDVHSTVEVPQGLNAIPGGSAQRHSMFCNSSTWDVPPYTSSP